MFSYFFSFLFFLGPHNVTAGIIEKWYKYVKHADFALLGSSEEEEGMAHCNDICLVCDFK